MQKMIQESTEGWETAEDTPHVDTGDHDLPREGKETGMTSQPSTW